MACMLKKQIRGGLATVFAVCLSIINVEARPEGANNKKGSGVPGQMVGKGEAPTEPEVAIEMHVRGAVPGGTEKEVLSAHLRESADSEKPSDYITPLHTQEGAIGFEGQPLAVQIMLKACAKLFGSYEAAFAGYYFLLWPRNASCWLHEDTSGISCRSIRWARGRQRSKGIPGVHKKVD